MLQGSDRKAREKEWEREREREKEKEREYYEALMRMREIADGRFLVREKIGSGSFGDVYIGIAQDTGQEVAIKLESTNTRHPQLRFEMKTLKTLQGGVGVAELFYYGVERYWSALVISLLGSSLEDLFNFCKRRFSPACVMLVGEQLIDRIEYLHSKNIIHRDIKPDNFLIGRKNEKDLIYIIDFGLAKQYYYPSKGRHIPWKEGKNLTGTPRYASIYNHRGYEQSRRDDIESIGYVLVYFARGKLPWQGLKAPSKKEKYRRIMEKKESTSLEELCAGTPRELYKFLEYAKGLEFAEQPDYQYLRGLFRKAIDSGTYGDPNKAMFDWLPGARNPYFPGQNPNLRRPPRSPRGPPRMPESGFSNTPMSLLRHPRGESIQRTPRASTQRPYDYEGTHASGSHRRDNRRRRSKGKSQFHDFKLRSQKGSMPRTKPRGNR